MKNSPNEKISTILPAYVICRSDNDVIYVVNQATMCSVFKTKSIVNWTLLLLPALVDHQIKYFDRDPALQQ